MKIIIANAFGIIALIMLCLSYQNKKRLNFLYQQLVSGVCYLVQYLLLGAFSAAATSVISFIRTLLFAFLEKKSNKISKIRKIKNAASNRSYIRKKKIYKKIKRLETIILICTEIAIIIAGIFTYTEPMSIIPIIIAIVFTFGMFCKDLRITYFIATLCPIGWLFYNYHYQAYATCIGSVIEFLAGLLGLIKIIKYKNKQNKKSSV
ncbi:MAG: YgjV family protein, partial [archaeon]|nr:YgjV family protein [archaeon]